MKKTVNTLYQYSTMISLISGNLRGSVEFGKLLEHGDFGLGTFDELDGELVLLDGKGYQLTSSGQVNPLTKDMTTPFASLTYFQPTYYHEITTAITKENFEQLILNSLPTKNLFVAIHVKGKYSIVKTRTVARQTRPYPPLSVAVDQQTVHTVNDTFGDLIGIWSPSFTNAITVEGFHFHFLNNEKNFGGHIFDFELSEGNVEIALLDNMHLELPTNQEYFEANLNIDNLQAQINKAEKSSEA